MLCNYWVVVTLNNIALDLKTMCLGFFHILTEGLSKANVHLYITSSTYQYRERERGEEVVSSDGPVTFRTEIFKCFHLLAKA